uniref:Neurotransmitter-gated ion-channel transmembrane domain-containing protein n=1 Tax=Panagrolaimus sp. JU765 TaxID=591449 RepID=A0AC34QE31_9BILA
MKIDDKSFFSLVIPSAFITVVTIVGFFTPHSTTGENTEKVSLGVTAVLSTAIIMLMIGDNIPATAEVIPLVAKYYIGLIFIIFSAALSTPFTLSYQMRGNIGERMSPRMRYFLFERIAKNPVFNWLFAVQLTSKKNIGRAWKHYNEANVFMFENKDATPTRTEGLANNGYKTTTLSYNTDRKAKIVQMEEITGDLKKYAI